LSIVNYQLTKDIMAKFSQVISVEQEIYFMEQDKEQNELRSPFGHAVRLDSAYASRSLLSKSSLFSAYELNYCQKKQNPQLSIAGLWCAKQAFVKAIRHKLEFSDFNYLDLEIRHQLSGQPTILLYGGLANWFKQQNLAAAVTIAHTKTLAIASVLLWR
jgi:holo-[acyl-carrier protein] synthase